VPETIYAQALWAITVLVLGFAFLKGDEPERIGAAAIVLVSVAAVLSPEDRSFDSPLWGRMALDVLLLAIFAGLAWHSRRAWPVWSAAFQALIVTGHILVAANLRPSANAFAAVNNISNYGLLIALGVGTFWAWQERRAAAMGSEKAGPPRL
jgi:hypothetical protein